MSGNVGQCVQVPF